ncbi:MAG: NigD-like protein [Candidatus Cryptobacteroides sp.]
MKKSMIICALAATAFLSALNSCSKSEAPDYSLLYPNAIVTVKPVDETSFFLQLDDRTALLPVGTTKLPYGDKEMRAFVNYTETDFPEGADRDKFAKAVKINWMDSILTKTPKPYLGDGNDEAYGNDPVEILKSWMTVVEDGYITLNFTTLWGERNVKHEVNLLTGGNPENPYEVEFRHNAFGDVCGREGSGIVAFRITDLPDTNGETVKLTLKWNSFSGTKTAQFDYKTRTEQE